MAGATECSSYPDVRHRQVVRERIDVDRSVVPAGLALGVDRAHAMPAHVAERHGLELAAVLRVGAARVAGRGHAPIYRGRGGRVDSPERVHPEQDGGRVWGKAVALLRYH